MIEKVISAEASTIILSLPKFARFSSAEENFELLKHEADIAEKKISIESVDDSAVDLAIRYGIVASNPFFVSADGNKLMDIVPMRRRGAPHHGVAHAPEARVPEPEVVLVSSKFSHSSHASAPQDSDSAVVEDVEKETAAELEKEFGPVEQTSSGSRLTRASAVVIFLVLAISGALSYVALWVLPKAEIKIVAERKDFSFNQSVLVDKLSRSADPVAMKIPGQIFTERRNAALTFKANGKRQVTKKASGRMTIYNGYSSSKQILVAATRFESPDGNIFRLTQTVTVPGAKIEDGKIIPSSIEVSVVADKAGTDGNVGPVAQWTIPGLKGGPRFNSFYGESKGAMSGGFVGEQSYPADDDIKKSKATLAATLEDGIKAALLAKIPQDFKTVEGGAQFALIKQTVNTDVDSQGLFTIYGDAEISVVAFRESDVLSVAQVKMLDGDNENFLEKTHSLVYGIAKPDFGSGKMTLPVDFKAELVRQVAVADIRAKALSKSERDLKALLLAQTGLQSAQVSFWPFWVRSVPSRSDKVNITVE